jgi:hypothetical protein
MQAEVHRESNIKLDVRAAICKKKDDDIVTKNSREEETLDRPETHKSSGDCP